MLHADDMSLVPRTDQVDQAKRIAKALGFHYRFVRHFRYQGGEYGLAVLSRYAILSNQRIRIKDSDLSFQLVKVKSPLGNVNVLNVHFRPLRFNLSARKQQLEQKAKKSERQKALFLIDKMEEKFKQPIIMLGDFNSIYNSYTYRKIKSKLIDSCRILSNESATYPAKSLALKHQTTFR